MSDPEMQQALFYSSWGPHGATDRRSTITKPHKITDVVSTHAAALVLWHLPTDTCLRHAGATWTNKFSTIKNFHKIQHRFHLWIHQHTHCHITGESWL